VEEVPRLVAAPGPIIIYCEKVEGLPKEWIRALMLLQMTLKKEKRDLRIADLSTLVQNFLKREGMDHYFLQSRNLKEAQRVQFPPAAPPKRKLDMEFLNPFLTATLRVLKVQASTTAVPAQAYIRKPTDTLTGDNHTLNSNSRGPVVVIPFDSYVGKFCVEISLSA
jgi:hypothetical protein